MNIGIKDLKVTCIIGTMKEEREVEQDLFIDLEITIEPPKKDHLEDTLDYVALAQFAQDIARRGFFLLESLAQTMLDELFETFPVEYASITIKKPNAFPYADHAYVSIEKNNTSYEIHSDLWSRQEIGR